MKKYFLLVLFVCLFLTTSAQSIYYVSAGNGSDLNNGSGWKTAFATLAKALSVASTGSEIRVAQGVYKPSNILGGGTDQRDKAFVISGFKIYGGYKGGLGTDANSRDNTLYKTILSGDLDGDGTFKNNSYHVVIVYSAAESMVSILDGFTIKGGNADGTGKINTGGKDFNRNYGAGIYIRGTSLEISVVNCSVIENVATGFGAAIFNEKGYIKYSTISSNKANGNGGGVYNSGGGRIISSIISNNIADGEGGGVYNSISIIVNSIINKNKSGSNGGGILHTAGSITNCTITENSATLNGGGVSNNTNKTINNTIICGNSALFNPDTETGALMTNVHNCLTDTDPEFIDAGSENYRLSICSPAVNAGDNSRKPSDIGTDLDLDISGLPRIYNKTGGGIIDLGVYEYQDIYNSVKILYVDSARLATGDGKSWGSAFKTLNEALSIANCPGSVAKEIRVAKGTYIPSRMAGNGDSERDRSFLVTSNVKLLGGFKGGTGSDANTRNSLLYKTLLSGDLDEDGSENNNAYHVVIAYADVSGSTTLIDGFTITGGNANGVGSIDINDWNILRTDGGGITVRGRNSGRVNITNNIIASNNTLSIGAGAFIKATSAGNVYFINNLVSNNHSTASGGGVYALSENSGSHILVVNNTVVNNSSSLSGGGVSASVLLSGSIKLSNTILWGNTAPIDKNYHSLITLGIITADNCLIQEKIPGDINGTNNLDGSSNNPNAVSGKIFENYTSGNYRLTTGSMALNLGSSSSIDATGITVDMDRLPRKIGAVDIGAYEFLWGGLTLKGDTLTYDGLNHSISGPIGGLDKLVGFAKETTNTSVGGANAGIYNVRRNVSMTISPKPYRDTTIIVFLVVKPKKIIATANGGSSIYGSSPANPGVKIEGLVNNDVINDFKNDFAIKPTSPVGEYKLKVIGNLTNPNYSLVESDRKSDVWTVKKASLIVNAARQEMIYGSDPSKLDFTGAYTITGYVNSQNESVLTSKPIVRVSSTINSLTGIGSYPDKVIVSGANAINYQFVYNSGILDIVQNKDKYLVFDPVGNKLYSDGLFVMKGYHKLDKNVTFSSSNASILSVSTDGTSIIKGVGSVTVFLKFAGDSNLAAEQLEQTITIDKASLSVKARNQVKQFNQANPDVSQSYDFGTMVNASDISGFTSLPVVAITQPANAPVGEYPDGVVVSGGAHPFYNLIYTAGNLSVVSTHADILFPTLGDKTYGDAEFILTASHAGGNPVKFQSSDPTIVEIVQSGSTWKAIIKKAGSIKIKAYNDAGNGYLPSEAIQTLNVKKATVIIQPYEYIRRYARNNPVIKILYSGLKYNDVGASFGAFTVSTQATPDSPVGDYPITASVAGNSNYEIIYKPGKISIVPGTMSRVVFRDTTAVYNGRICRIQARRLPAGSSVTYINNTRTISGTSVAEAIIKHPNYNDLTLKAIITITKAPIKVTARELSMFFGNDPSWLDFTGAYDITGFVNNENEGAFTVLPEVRIDPSINAFTHTGTYPEKAIVGGALAVNYEFSYVTNTVNVLQNTGKNLLFDPISSKIYSDAPFHLSGRHMLNKPMVFGSTDESIIAVNANGNSEIRGVGNVTLFVEFIGDNDVADERLEQTVAVGKAALTVKARDQVKMYNTPSPDVSGAYDLGILVDADDINGFTSFPQASIITLQNAPPGDYHENVIVSGGVHPFYNLSYVNGNLTVVNAHADIYFPVIGDKIYGDAEFNITATHISGNPVELTSSDPSIIEVEKVGTIWKAKILKVGVTEIKAHVDEGGGYEASDSIQKIIVDKALLMIRPYNRVRRYAVNNPEFIVQFSRLQYNDTGNSLGTIITNTTANADSNVGDYPIIASGAANENYEILYNEGVLTIKQARLSLKLKPETVSYNGLPRYINPADISGIIGNSSINISYEYFKDGAVTDYALYAGTYLVRARAVGDDNYEPITSNEVNYVVKKIVPQIMLSSKSVNYTGYPVKIDDPVISGSVTAKILNTTIYYKGINGTDYGSYEPPVNSGEYEVVVSVTGDINHADASAKTILIIGTNNPNMTIIDGEFEYDGTAKTLQVFIDPVNLPVTYQYKGVQFDNTVYLSTNDPVNAGKYRVTATTAGDNNYSGTFVEAMLTINQIAPKIIIQNKIARYTGQPVSVEAESDPNTILLEIQYKGIDNTSYFSNSVAPVEIGNYQATALFAGDNNYMTYSASANLTITRSDIPTLILKNKFVTYNNAPQSIDDVTILPDEASGLPVTYIYSNAFYAPNKSAPVNAGVYSVLAYTPSGKGFEETSVLATLTIEKANQILYFDKTQLDGKIIGDQFNLIATSTSGLPVKFLSSNNDIAEIDDNGNMIIKGSGVLTVTATQPGNENYNSADPVYHSVVILSNDASVHKIYIDGNEHDILNLYATECFAEKVDVMIETDVKATVDIGKNFEVTLVDKMAGIVKIPFRITSHQGNYQDYVLLIEKRFDFDEIIYQKWDNTFMIDLRKLEDVFDYVFTSYKWYKNEIIVGTGSYYSSGVNRFDFLDDKASYRTELIMSNNFVLHTCPKTPTLHYAHFLVYPNPVQSGGTVSIKTDLDDDILKDAVIEIYSMSGNKIGETKVTGKITSVSIPNILGVYMIKLKSKNLNRSFKITVN